MVTTPTKAIAITGRPATSTASQLTMTGPFNTANHVNDISTNLFLYCSVHSADTPCTTTSFAGHYLYVLEFNPDLDEFTYLDPASSTIGAFCVHLHVFCFMCCILSLLCPLFLFVAQQARSGSLLSGWRLLAVTLGQTTMSSCATGAAVRAVVAAVATVAAAVVVFAWLSVDDLLTCHKMYNLYLYCKYYCKYQISHVVRVWCVLLPIFKRLSISSKHAPWVLRYIKQIMRKFP